MDNATRLAYLKAMGIEVWVPLSSNEQCSHLDFNEQTPAPGMVDDAEIREQHDERSAALPFSEHWRQLQERVAGCSACDLCQSRTQTVFGTGNPHADWMLIGEAPGFNEDKEGKPFVGRAGALLTEMLRAIGLSRDEVFIANILKCRPPENRDPKPSEIEACADHLQQQIKLVQPKIILALGRFAAQNLLNSNLTIGKLRGTVHHLYDIPVIVIYHPAYLLRSLTEKRKAWDDLKMALKVYKNIAI